MDWLLWIAVWFEDLIFLAMMIAKDREFFWNEKHGYVSEKYSDAYDKLRCFRIIFTSFAGIVCIQLAGFKAFSVCYLVIAYAYSWISMIINDKVSKERGFSYQRAKTIAKGK